MSSIISYNYSRNLNVNQGLQDGEDETEIDLASMFAHLLRHWKMVLVWMVVATLAIGGVGTLRDWQSGEGQYSDEAMASLQESMTIRQIGEVDQLFERYQTYQRTVSDNQDYLKNSILMNLDPSDVYTRSMEYLVTSDQTDVVNSFANQALGEEEYQAIAKSLSTDGQDADARYVSELVSISSVGEAASAASPDSVEITSEDGSRTLWNGGTITNGYKGLMRVSILTQTKAEGDAIAPIVEEALTKHAQVLDQAGVVLQLAKVSDNAAESASTSLAVQQQNAVSQGSTLVSSSSKFYTDNIDSLADEEKTYFEFLEGRANAKAAEHHYGRYFGIGALVGLAAALVVLIIGYLSSSRYRTVDELAKDLATNGAFVYRPGNGSGSESSKDGKYLKDSKQEAKRGGKKSAEQILTPSILGVAVKKAGSKGSAFQKLADRIDYRNVPDVQLADAALDQMMSLRVGKLCEKYQVRRLYLVCNYSSKYANGVAAELLRQLQGYYNFDAVETGMPTRNPQDLALLGRCEAAVLVEGMDEVSRAETLQALQLCAENNVPVVGAVAVCGK